MLEYIQVFINAFLGTLDWTLKSITFQVPFYENYFWGLVLLSVFVWILEIKFPWRKKQGIFRKDFGLDVFYMFFNFFLFTIAISGIYEAFTLLLSSTGMTSNSLQIIPLEALSLPIQLLLFFVLLDFMQWCTHILLHKYSFLWAFHKIHHSVKEMGFAAHLRYHWMENILYKPLKTIGLMLLGGFEPQHAYVIHFIAIAIGHFNHANLNITWGPFKYVFNNPVMHLHHHAHTQPQGKVGVNFGISLSLWDFLFKTSFVPKTDPHLPLGFPGDEEIPTTFWGQFRYGFKRNS